MLGLQKLSLGKEEQVTPEEAEHLTKLLLPNHDVPTFIEIETSFALSILNQGSQVRKKMYMNVDFIPVGSVMVESLFSIVGHIFHDRRLSTSPVNVEEQVFLRMNNHLWNLSSFLAMDIPDQGQDLV